MQENNCRHEYVRIFQRRLKGIDRRLLSTKAYLPIGFKLGDFSYLSEGSFCFCSTCRVRLYPKRTNAEKEQARLLARAAKAQIAGQELIDEVGADLLAEVLLNVEEDTDISGNTDKLLDIHVDEMETQGVDVQDIEAEGVILTDEEDDDVCSMQEKL